MEFEAVDMAGKGKLWGTICGLHQLGLEYAQAVRSAHFHSRQRHFRP